MYFIRVLFFIGFIIFFSFILLHGNLFLNPIGSFGWCRLNDTSIRTSCPLGQLDTPVSSWEQDSDKLTFILERQEEEERGTPVLDRGLRPPIDSAILDTRTEDSSWEEEELSRSVWTLANSDAFRQQAAWNLTLYHFKCNNPSVVFDGAFGRGGVSVRAWEMISLLRFNYLSLFMEGGNCTFTILKSFVNNFKFEQFKSQTWNLV